MKKVIAILVAAVLTVCALSGCSEKSAGSAESESVSEESTEGTVTETETETPEKVTHTAAEYAEAGVDELNSVPILMYHRIYDMKDSETDYTGGNVDADGYNRTSESFENDLEQFYEWGYRCMRLTDYIDGNIDVEFGYSPIIITFDDGIEEAHIDGFDENGDPIWSENSALAVLERVKERHPDFNVTATFFLNYRLFENGEELDRKLIKWMVDNGYDIGNHTWEHIYIPDEDEETIATQVGKVYELLEDIIPGQYVNIIALPYGAPTDVTADSKYAALKECTYNGKTYKTKATLLCSWTREDSPFITKFDPYYVKRIRAYDNNGEEFDIQQNFEALNNGKRYISDGDPDTIVVRSEDREQWLGETYGKNVIEY